MAQNFQLFDTCKTGGCGAKMAPKVLGNLLGGLPVVRDENLLIGYEGKDDAAVYKINESQCIVSTTDFFPPMVNDPYLFGQIAATNALSDIYAMGATPLLALNLVCFPEENPVEMLQQILAGGACKLEEAGCNLGGGHSIYDIQIKYGLAVTGIVEEKNILTNSGAQMGDIIILTKALGVGTLTSAARENAVPHTQLAQGVQSMTRLNRYAAEKMKHFPVTACTDVTGFGLLGHCLEMAKDVSVHLYTGSLPVLAGARTCIQNGYLTAAGIRNQTFAKGHCDLHNVEEETVHLLCDPQTSGGLLIAVEAGQGHGLLKAIQQDDPSARIIGEVVKKQAHPVVFSK